jgi:hypothetical protein
LHKYFAPSKFPTFLPTYIWIYCKKNANLARGFGKTNPFARVYNSRIFFARCAMLILIIGVCMLLSLLVGAYIAVGEKYNASEATCALLVLNSLFLGLAFVIYGLTEVF